MVRGAAREIARDRPGRRSPSGAGPRPAPRLHDLARRHAPGAAATYHRSRSVVTHFTGCPVLRLRPTASVARVVASSDASEIGIGPPRRTAPTNASSSARWPLSTRASAIDRSCRRRPATPSWHGSCRAVRCGRPRTLERLLGDAAVARRDVGDAADRSVVEHERRVDVAGRRRR